MSNAQVTFEPFKMSTSHLFQTKLHFIKYCLTQWISKLPGSIEIHWVMQYLVNFTALVGIVNTTTYKTEPILQVSGNGKLT